MMSTSPRKLPSPPTPRPASGAFGSVHAIARQTAHPGLRLRFVRKRRRPTLVARRGITPLLPRAGLARVVRALSCVAEVGESHVYK